MWWWRLPKCLWSPKDAQINQNFYALLNVKSRSILSNIYRINYECWSTDKLTHRKQRTFNLKLYRLYALWYISGVGWNHNRKENSLYLWQMVTLIHVLYVNVTTFCLWLIYIFLSDLWVFVLVRPHKLNKSLF